ncbi:MAG: hypothetical protein J6D42_01270 [Clostridia bacterium]|nr:hypothetical protein [Clostridia bacterium]
MQTKNNVKKKSRLRFPTDEVNMYLHSRFHENEDDNSSVEAFNKSQEVLYFGTSPVLKYSREYQYNERLKHRNSEDQNTETSKSDEEYSYHIRDKPTEESRNKQIQKKQIKKQYVKQARERIKETAQKVWAATKETTRKTDSFVVKHWKVIAVIFLILLVLTILFSALISVLAVFSSSFSSVVGSTYISADNEIISAENKYIQLEEDLQREIDNVENTYGGYDEYVYDIDEIKHDPYILTSILSAMYLEYSVEDIQNTLKMLFDKQYIFMVTSHIEIRYKTETRTVTYTDSETGEVNVKTYEVEVPYEYKILNVSLQNIGLQNLAVEVLTSEQYSMYELYMATLGNRPDLFSE